MMDYILNKVKVCSMAMGLLALATAMLTSCGQEDFEAATAESAKGKLVFNIFDANVAGTRAATDGQTMITTFNTSDQAGIYAVKNGQVILENVPLTYSASGFWEAAEAIEASDEFTGAKFYAYYPYRQNAQFNASAANPFAEMVTATAPAKNQNQKAEYEYSDIMVTAAASIGQYNTVSLPLAHQKALVCVELPNKSYIFDNAGMEPYVVAKAENAKFKLGETAIQPYFDENSQSYRFIVEPGEANDLTLSFTNNGVERSYIATTISQIQAGQYGKYVVDGGAQLINMTLQTGDFYCADGSIISKDTPASELPKNIVGVVFKIGTTDAIRNANSNWSHGVVVALSDKRGKWGENASTTSAQNNAGWRYWYKDYGLADQNGATNAALLKEELMAEEGYETTKAWRAVPEPLAIGGITLDYTTSMNAAINDFSTANPLPAAICSGWYFPSLGDWQNLEKQLSTLSTQLKAAGGTDIRTDNHWSCNVRGAGSNWCYVVKKNTLADRYKGVACNNNAYYRFLLAF